MGRKLGRKFWPVLSRNIYVLPPFLPFLPNTPAYTAPARENINMHDPVGRKGRKSNQGEIDNEKRNRNHRPRGRERRPHRTAMPAVPLLPPVPVSLPPVPVPTPAAVAAVAGEPVAAAVAADARLVLTRGIAHRRDMPRPIVGGASCPQGAETREIPRKKPLPAPIWRAWGLWAGGGPPWGGFSPNPPPRAGGRKESPYRAEFPQTSAFSRNQFFPPKERHADHHDEHRGHPPV